MKLNNTGARSGVGMEISAVANAIKRNMPWFWQGEKSSLTGMQIWVLGYIANTHGDRELLQRDVEAAFDITRATASGILKRLERDGFIRRETSQIDARQKKLILTPRALEIYAALCHTVAEVDNEMLRGVPPEQVDIFFQVLDKIHNNLTRLSLDTSDNEIK